LETLTEVVLILVEINVVAVVTVGCVFERSRVLIIMTPTILAISLTGEKAFLITVADGAP